MVCKLSSGSKYSEKGNTREQLFHGWRSFHFDKNSESVDSYVTCIRQVVALLGYDKPWFLEVLRTPHFQQDYAGFFLL